jgi:tRNA U55 pseudouridine synthase TruB
MILERRLEHMLHAVGLRRTNIGEFDVESAISTKDINEQVVESIMGIDKVKEVLKI